MKKLYVMVGIPAAGKSTYIKEFIKRNPNTKVISRDNVRFSMVSESELYFSKEKLVFNEFINQIKESLIINEITFADATHISTSSRIKLLKALGGSLKNIEVNALVFKIPLKVCLERNAKRVGRTKVPDDAIINMNNNFTIPTLIEGFNKIIINHVDENGNLLKIEEVI